MFIDQPLTPQFSVFHQPEKLSPKTKPVACIGPNIGMQTVSTVAGLTWTDDIRKEYIPYVSRNGGWSQRAIYIVEKKTNKLSQKWSLKLLAPR
jgi:hypothetical protein